MVSVITTFQRVIYNPQPGVDDIPKDSGIGILPPVGVGWYLRNLSIVGAFAVVLLFVGLHVFGRLEDNFAEEI